MKFKSAHFFALLLFKKKKIVKLEPFILYLTMTPISPLTDTLIATLEI